MFMNRIILGVALCWLSLGLVTPSFAAPTKNAAAHVASVSSGAFVVRGETRSPLKVKDALYKEDTISTDSKGQVQLLFTDGTKVDLGADSMIKIADFSFGGTEKANFAMDLGRGLARVVSGKVVQQNPLGFNITTAQATIGIRGTELTTDVRDPKKTLVILTELGAGHYVGVFNTATGKDMHMNKAGLSCEITASETNMRPTTPAEAKIAQPSR